MKIFVIIPIVFALVISIAIPSAFAVPTEIWFQNGQVVNDANPQVRPSVGNTSPAHTDDIECQIASNDNPNGFSRCYIFKSFNATEVSGLNVTTTWFTASSPVFGFGEVRLDIRDGSYSLGDTDFPKNQTSPTSKGNGLIERVFQSLTPVVAQRTDNFNMPFENQSSTGFVTVFFELFDNDDVGGADKGETHLNNFTITDFGSWKFGSDEGSVRRLGNFASDGCGEFQSNVICGDFTGHGIIDLTDLTPPIITLLGENPQQSLKGSTYGEQGATCIDVVDGDITGNLIIDSSAIDMDTIASYIVTYDCTDNSANANSASQVIRTFQVVGASGGGGGQRVTTAGGVATSVPSLSDIPPLSVVPSEPTVPPRRTLDEIFDLFSLLFERVEPTPTLEFVPEPESVTDIPAPLFEPTPTEEVRPSFIESIQNFFTRLFR